MIQPAKLIVKQNKYTLRRLARTFIKFVCDLYQSITLRREVERDNI